MRLIDADALIEALNIFNGGNPHFLNGIETAKEIIANMSITEAAYIEEITRYYSAGCEYGKKYAKNKLIMALFVLYQARDVLLENGWAVNEGDNYRDKDAQQLKEDIDKMIEKLKNPESQSSQDQKDDSSQEEKKESDGNSGNNSKQNRQQEELEKNKEGAMKERQQERQEAEEDRKEKQKNGGGGDKDDSASGGKEEGGGQQNIKQW